MLNCCFKNTLQDINLVDVSLCAYIWCEEELNSIQRAFQSQSSDEEDSEDQIRQSGRDVDGLRNEGMTK